MKCPDCYAARFAFPGVEFNNREGKEMIDKIAEWNVFQLAIGGGEPLEHEDISALVAYASSCGLVVHLTTGRQYVSPDTLVDFAGNLTTLQLGINSNLLLNYPQEYLRNLSNLIRTASDSGIKTGANICLNKSVLKNFRIIIDKLINTGLERFTLLRYKPPASISRWHEQLPEIKQLLGLRTELEKIVKLYPGINLRIDCALSFFQHDLLPGAAQWHGIIGCAAGTRIVSVGPDGSVYPCSQLVAPEFCAGNLFSGNAKSIWNDSPVMRNYRAFREANTFKNSMCGTCESKYFCGGCRVFSVDAIGGDPGCPVHYSAKKDIPENLSPEYDAYPNWISHSKSQGEMKHENHLVT
jgi:radical SAM protein with 4Fe4S-binding SPASM domain